MALHSEEEIPLETMLARTLGNVLSLGDSGEARVWPSSGDIGAHTPPEAAAPAALVRLLQFCILPGILGPGAGTAVYLAAKRFGAGLGLGSVEALREWTAAMGIGDLEVELDAERVLVKLSRCLSCSRLPATGTAVCDLERGLVDGVLEGVLGTAVTTRETLCWSLGDTVCQFEAYAAVHTGYAYPEGGSHPEAQRRLLGQLADQSELALDTLRLIHERRELQTHDPLTGLLNFRGLREHADVELARAARHGRGVAVVLLDLDGFGEVDRTLGREAGDEVLCHWAAALTAQLRDCDHVCRYGADEFVLALPETQEQEVGSALARVLRTTEQLGITVAGRALRLTACAGVAVFPHDGRAIGDLVAKATTTMYTARAAGPGRVSFFSSPPRG